jgi:tetratricopeptide (TPR) repeat protein
MVRKIDHWIMCAGAALGLFVNIPAQAVEPQVAPTPTNPQPRRSQAAPTPTNSQPRQPQRSDQFPPNPLEFQQPDPLLPGGLKRPLSAAEQRTLRTALDELNNQATTALRSGDVPGAFDLWNRELRLRRALGVLEETQALGRVGEQAWKQNQATEVQYITRRLKQIQDQVQTPDKTKGQVSVSNRAQVLPALGGAYQLVRSPGLALGVYQQMLADARQRRDAVEEVNSLNTIGQLHLSWFDYPPAIATYTELLNLARSRNDSQSVLTNLIQLAYAYEQANQPAQAAQYQEQVIGFYQKNQQSELIPALKIRLADNYAASRQLDLAEKNYQDAFELARPLVQFAYASDALQKLGVLYRSNNRLDAALKVYDYLATVQQQAYDIYGVMDAYDQIGQIQLQRKAYPEALNAFQQGLEFAKQINYRTDYFNAQIQKASQQSRQ